MQSEPLTGRELDAEVERRVFERAVEPGEDPASPYPYSADLPRYCADIAAAWEVVERIGELEDRRPGISGTFTEQLDRSLLQMGGPTTLWVLFYGHVSAPERICRAALAAIGTDQNGLILGPDPVQLDA
jgi:hypothetical protein